MWPPARAAGAHAGAPLRIARGAGIFIGATEIEEGGKTVFASILDFSVPLWLTCWIPSGSLSRLHSILFPYPFSDRIPKKYFLTLSI